MGEFSTSPNWKKNPTRAPCALTHNRASPLETICACVGPTMLDVLCKAMRAVLRFRDHETKEILGVVGSKV